MELEARLRAFSALARRGSFSRAAAELRISQPAVSRHVAELERRVGIPLVVRDRRGLQLTPAGDFLAGYVARAEALLAQSSVGLVTFRNPHTGCLPIAASGTPGIYVLPRLIAEFRAARPDVDMEVELGTSAQVVEGVRAHRVELGVVGGLASAPDLETEPLIEDELVIIGNPKLAARHPSSRDLEELTWLSREEGSATAVVVEHAWSTIGFRPRRRLRLPDWEMVKRAVAGGAGIAAISRFAIGAELETGRLAIIEVPGWHVVRPLSVIRPRDVPLTPLAAQFLDMLRGLREQGELLAARPVQPPAPAPGARRSGEPREALLRALDSEEC
jgi:LysR family transcriptional regulator, transcriptional activator of the cysJI operon